MPSRRLERDDGNQAGDGQGKRNAQGERITT